jgi:hypothetical protein
LFSGYVTAFWDQTRRVIGVGGLLVSAEGYWCQFFFQQKRTDTNNLALLGRLPVGVEKSALTTPCPVAAGSVFSGKVQQFVYGEGYEELLWLGLHQPSAFYQRSSSLI